VATKIVTKPLIFFFFFFFSDPLTSALGRIHPACVTPPWSTEAPYRGKGGMGRPWVRGTHVGLPVLCTFVVINSYLWDLSMPRSPPRAKALMCLTVEL
jgi:hypothetical protein